MMVKGMTKQKFKTKDENKLYFCKMCAFVATSYEELEIHYALSHEDPDDRIYEFKTEFITKNTKKQKKKDLKEKAIEDLKLLIEGKHYHNEYVGWCETRYDLRTENIGNKYIIDLVPRITIC
jgi:hypothetical protein